MPTTVLHLRSETKLLERRSALTPSTADALLDAGYVVRVERGEGRIFEDEQFEAISVCLVPDASWVDALGRCGSGAVDLCRAAGIPPSHILQRDMTQTAAPIPRFVTLDSLSQPGRRLRVVCDVSCDPGNPFNPLPTYQDINTFLEPTLEVEV
ncbi:MAG: Saccharopine dehydrogenase [Watsoniomyces obsoletus]|nr:MAG: Saccharopine dehydrogenase [Watsoniomyces obsoletus]